jgi:RimJ/RimL family protein N-acetyltransferase
MIRLTPISDYSSIREWANDPELAEYFRRYPPTFVWDSPEILKQAFVGSFYICDEDQVIGLISMLGVDQQNRNMEFGGLVDKKRCPKRARAFIEASRQLADYGFEYLQLNKIYCRILSTRKDLARLLAIHGFQKDGNLRQNIFYKGELRDELVFSLLRDDYRRLKP